MTVQPVVLCGGSGTRLWPLSRQSFPKQFVPLIGNKSLLQLTLERLALLCQDSNSKLMWIAAEEHRFLVSEAMPSASTAYGYIQQGKFQPDGSRRVERFIEKPDAMQA